MILMIYIYASYIAIFTITQYKEPKKNEEIEKGELKTLMNTLSPTTFCVHYLF